VLAYWQQDAAGYEITRRGWVKKAAGWMQNAMVISFSGRPLGKPAFLIMH